MDPEDEPVQEETDQCERPHGENKAPWWDGE